MHGASTALRRPVRVGISSCLLGEAVRFDGGHKRHALLTGALGPFVEWVPVCPEVESGLGTPRESMRLVRRDARVRLLTVRTGVDLTARLAEHSEHRLAALAGAGLSGYVLKKDSPSCGLERVRVYSERGMPERTGRGVFAAGLVERFPDLPVEEEGRLSDARLREHFLERVFGYARVQALFEAGWTTGALVRFHAAHKLLLLAHSPEWYRELGRLVAGARTIPRDALARRYTASFMAALRTPATTPRHVNVLQHMAGYFTRRVDRDTRLELADAIEEYRRTLVPRLVPLTLLRHLIRAEQVAYLAGQSYLEPFPRELAVGLP